MARSESAVLATKPLWDAELGRGFRLNQLSLLERIGYGGEGVVWSAWDSRRQSIVAVKLIPVFQAGPSSGQVWEEFERQVHLVASLDHPHILPLYEFGATDDFFFFVMQYNPLGSLANRLYLGALSLESTLSIVSQVVSSLSYLHARGIIYRDLKPSNLLMDSQNRIYLSDFGLARRLSFETQVHHTGRGTGPYAPPEQHAHLTLTPQSDIFSLGVMIYEMLTGSLPWEGREFLGALQVHGKHELPDQRQINAALPAALLPVLRLMTAPHWQHRPETAVAALNLLNAAVGDVANIRQAVLVPEAQADFEQKPYSFFDAQHFLREFAANWQADSEAFPLRLSHLAFIDAEETRQDAAGLTLSREQKIFMLRGALANDFKVDYWWQQVENPEDRLAVCEQTILLEGETAVTLALHQLHEDAVTLQKSAGLSLDTLEKLLELAVSQKNWTVRNQVLAIVSQATAHTKNWREVGISWIADARLSHLASTDSAQAKHAARLIGMIRSETAVKALLDLQPTKGQAWLSDILQTIWAQAGSLPSSVPPLLRLRIAANQMVTRVVEDKGIISLPRLGIGLAMGLLTTVLMIVGIFGTIDEQTRDTLLAPYPPSNIITIVEIDDASLEKYGRWGSWPRTLHAQLINQLNAAGAQAIVFDVIFDTSATDDAELISAMQEAGNVIQPVLAQGDAFLDKPGTTRFLAQILPQPEIRAATVALGHTNILHDRDGYVRKIPAIVSIGDQRYPSLALAALQVYLTGQQNLAELPSPEARQLSLAGRQIPVGENGEIRLYYAGPPAAPENHTFTQVSYADVLQGNAPAELFRNKIVLIGITATAEPDRYLTPVSDGRPMYGVEIIANLIESIWSGKFIHRPPQGALSLILIFLSLLTAVIAFRPWSGLLLTAFLGVGYYLVGLLLFERWALMLDLIYPFLAIALTYGSITTYRLSVEARLRREVMRLFANNVNPNVAQAALDAVRRGELNLGGQVKEITILAIEYRGHKQLTAAYEPSQIVSMVNMFKAQVTKTALQFDGTIAHSEGDLIMVLFNAPLSQTDHVWRSVQTALNLQKKIDQLAQDNLEPAFIPNEDYGCGIYSGKAIVGSFGEPQRAVYTAFGEIVSIASQLAAHAKDGQILLGESVYQQLQELVVAEKQSPITVKERAMPVVVYALIGTS